MPTPQSIFHEAPRTNILPTGEESDDRAVLLPELARVVTLVNDTLQRVQAPLPPLATDVTTTMMTTSTPISNDLPWQRTTAETPVAEPIRLSGGTETCNIVVPVEDRDIAEEEEEATVPIPEAPAATSSYNRRELQDLATLLDRLGRTLTDAAPHIASLAASIPEETRTEATPSGTTEANADSTNAASSSLSPPPAPIDEDVSSPPLSGLLSILSRERARQTARETTETEATASSSSPAVNPDHVDYVSGLVNTTRGEVRSGPRSNRPPSMDDATNLLSAYLAAMSLGGLGVSSSGTDGDDDAAGGLGQLLRGSTGGGNGVGGIDIHIHAVVTAPGMGPTGLTIGSTGDTATTTTTTTTAGGNSSARRIIRRGRQGTSSSFSRNTSSISNPSTPTTAQALAEEDIGLFSELYSETPEPIDPNGSPLEQGRGSFSDGYRRSRNGGENVHDFLRRMTEAVESDTAPLGPSTVMSSPSRRFPRMSVSPRRRESNSSTTNPNDTPSSMRSSESNRSTSSSRRSSSGWGRLFRRRRNRDSE